MEYKVKGNAVTAVVLLFLVAAVSFITGQIFLESRLPDPVAPAQGFESHMLSEWFDGIKDTPADTPVYVQDSGVPGGTVFIMGGTHPNEPAGYMTAIVYLERAKVTKGKLIVLPFANMTAMGHNSPQEASPRFFHLDLPDGEKRWFRYGSRASNPVYQWPNPDIYIHAQSGQKLAGSSKSNLNRAYPGLPDDGLTQKVAYAIIQLLKKEKVDLAFDLHEASPEYPVVNAIVAHGRAMELAAMVSMELEMAEIPMRLEPSPVNFRGLSHREWGDSTDTLAILMESGNPVQGRLRGKTDENLILTGKDKAYLKASGLGRLFIPYEGDQPLALRTARHVTAIDTFISMLGDVKEGYSVEVENIPSYDDMLEKGIGAFLSPVKDDRFSGK